MSDAGFTMIELTVAMVVAAILMASGVSGWLSYREATEHRGTAQELASALRNAQQAALAEAVTYCVSVDSSARSYTTYKFSCGSGRVAVKTGVTQSSRVGLANESFLQSDGSSNSTVSFTPRGSATKGSLLVTRQGSNKVYNISVEGLTGRVSLTG